MARLLDGRWLGCWKRGVEVARLLKGVVVEVARLLNGVVVEVARLLKGVVWRWLGC